MPETIAIAIVLASSFWVFWDARRIGVRKGRLQGFGNIGPVGWLFCCTFLWLPSFPVYLWKRGELLAINGKRGNPVASAAVGAFVIAAFIANWAISAVSPGVATFAAEGGSYRNPRFSVSFPDGWVTFDLPTSEEELARKAPGVGPGFGDTLAAVKEMAPDAVLIAFDMRGFTRDFSDNVVVELSAARTDLTDAAFGEADAGKDFAKAMESQGIEVVSSESIRLGQPQTWFIRWSGRTIEGASLLGYVTAVDGRFLRIYCTARSDRAEDVFARFDALMAGIDVARNE